MLLLPVLPWLLSCVGHYNKTPQTSLSASSFIAHYSNNQKSSEWWLSTWDLWWLEDELLQPTMSQQGKDGESNGTAAGDKEGPGVSALQNNGGQGTDNSGGNAGDTSGDVTMTAAQMQTYMSRRKGAITKHLSALNRLIAERDINGLKSRLVNISKAFVAFEEIHEQYLATLDDANDIEACVKYFLHVDHDYSEGVNAANMWLEDYLHVDHDNRVSPPGATAVMSPGESAKRDYEMSRLLRIPQVNLDVFTGNPLDYQNFIAVFEESVDSQFVDDQQKLTRLLQYTGGVAKAAIKHCAVIKGSKGYQQARDILHTRFGDDQLISRKIIETLKEGKITHNATQMQKLVDDLSMAKTTLESLNMLSEVDNQYTILEILQRCPDSVQCKWHKRALTFKDANGYYPGFSVFVDFVSKLSKTWCDPVYGKDALKSFKQQYLKSVTSHTTEVKPLRDNDRDRVSNTAQRSSTLATTRPCVVCNQSHRLYQCEPFKSKQPDERFQIVKSNKLCFNCLLPYHNSRNCRKPSQCSVPNCGLKHSKFLHVARENRFSSESASTSVNPASSSHNNQNGASSNLVVSDTELSSVNCGASSTRRGRTVYLPTVAVEVNGVQVYAMLDNCSTDSFITESLASRLQLRGEACDYVLNTVAGSENKKSSVVEASVASTDGSFQQDISNLVVVPRIPSRYVPRHVDISEYPHLTDLALSPVPVGSQVDLLIGQDNPDMICPRDVRFNPECPKDPYATKSVFGWCLNGLVGNNGDIREISSHFIQTECNVEKLWTIECQDFDDTGYSMEDQKVLALWDQEIKRVEGHYCLPIPWRNGKPELPNNRALACHRLNGLNKRLSKQGLTEVYDQNVRVMFEKGYAEPVPEPEINLKDGTVWYLPHHPVLNKKGKVRPVFDCAAKYQGISLNSQCYQGPDLTNKLMGVLLRFRQFKYAITADIEAMYLQVKIPESDRNALRFLWYDDAGSLTEYRMNSHLFGGVWSASSSAFALKRTAADCPGSALVEDTIMRSFYVDDLLKSVDSIENGVEVIHGVKHVLSHGGFNITKFTVNDNALLEEIDDNDRVGGVKEIAPDLFSKSLGLEWEVSSDTFRYTSKPMPSREGPITRRQMLSYVSSLYDPLGLISPVVLQGKVLFQDATALKLGWDDNVPLHLENKWWEWLDSLPELNELSFNRCVVPDSFENGVFELHHFSDASERSYGACSYLRVITPQGKIHVSLLASKGRLAPLKTLSVPRLELSAALTATKLDELIRKHFELHTIDSMFWTDSEIVLAYIRNESRRFHVFVANRVSQIRQTSEACQWSHVPGKVNPADVISRGCRANSLPPMWFNGPDFLWDYKSNWPVTRTSADVLSNDPEIKPQAVACVTAPARDDVTTVLGLNALIAHYSSYHRLKKAVCWFNRFVLYLSHGDVSREPVSRREMVVAERQIVKHVQRECYFKELHDLRTKGRVQVSSSLNKLSPKLDGGLLVIGGRLHEAPLAQSVKTPAILPHAHRVSRLIVEEVHNDAHLGVEWVFTRLREQYWVIKVRALIKKVKRSCVVCRKMYAGPMVQKMANLPVDRCRPFRKAFAVCGVDLFGPFLVTVGRARVKRYACIYSCFTSRAVHIEKLDDLTTDSFINGLIRFVARRGQVDRVFSDNGTNMVGTHNELTRAFRQLDRHALVREARRRAIEWVFNPPHASHHGGLWERMIRTVRRVLVAILSPNARLTDEILHTVLCESENIVNSRPLTKCSDDASDDNPLTPNHFLVLSGNFSLPWANVSECESRWHSFVDGRTCPSW